MGLGDSLDVPSSQKNSEPGVITPSTSPPSSCPLHRIPCAKFGKNKNKWKELKCLWNEKIAMASDEESLEDEVDKDGIQLSVLKQCLNRIILICYAFQTLKVWEV